MELFFIETCVNPVSQTCLPLLVACRICAVRTVCKRIMCSSFSICWNSGLVLTDFSHYPCRRHFLLIFSHMLKFHVSYLLRLGPLCLLNL